MARFDIYRLRDGGALVVDCQSDLIDYFDTRLVVPLVPPDTQKVPIARLMPSFSIDGEILVMATHLAAAVPKTVLGPAVTSLAAHDLEISAAFAMLLSGF